MSLIYIPDEIEPQIQAFLNSIRTREAVRETQAGRVAFIHSSGKAMRKDSNLAHVPAVPAWLP